MSVPMALVDYVPVVLFFLASLILMRDLYHMMSKGAFALMAGGFIMIFVAGLFKATWKLLYALEVCDYQALNNAFFPMQSTGFLLAAIGLIALLVWRQSEKAAAVVPFTSNMPLVGVLIIGTAGLATSLVVLSAKMKKVIPTVLFIVYFVLMLAMGYLSSRDFSEPAMNWIGEGVNVVGQLIFLAAVWLLDKAGLKTFELKK